MRRVLVLLLVVTALATVAGCGSNSKSSRSSTAAATQAHTHFAKTKFLLHAGLAFGAFHHWIYKPFKAGDFSHPLRHKLTVVKALAAAAFVSHEVLLARRDIGASKLLSKVVLPLITIGGSVAVIRSALKSHQAPSASSVSSANSSISTVESRSSAAGSPITETTAGAPI
jgi:hypothetical protein